MVYSSARGVMVLCVVFGCSKRSGRDKDVWIPEVITTKGKDLESKKARWFFVRDKES